MTTTASLGDRIKRRQSKAKSRKWLRSTPRIRAEWRLIQALSIDDREVDDWPPGRWASEARYAHRLGLLTTKQARLLGANVDRSTPIKPPKVGRRSKVGRR